MTHSTPIDPAVATNARAGVLHSVPPRGACAVDVSARAPIRKGPIRKGPDRQEAVRQGPVPRESSRHEPSREEPARREPTSHSATCRSSAILGRARDRTVALLIALLSATFAATLPACTDASATHRVAPADGALPAQWRTLHSTLFEAALDERLPRGTSVHLDDATIDTLELALDDSPAVATRAAIWLARSGDARTPAILLERLERRFPAPERADDAGDATAAAALARVALGDDGVARLVELATGAAPHPDLEVRVECAIAALAHGNDTGLELLVRVLRIDTPSEAREGPLTDSATTAWVRGRSDEALCAFFGLPVEVRTDLPLAEREAIADAFEPRVVEHRAR